MAESFDSILKALDSHTTEGQAVKAFVQAESEENGRILVRLDKIIWVDLVSDASGKRIVLFLTEGREFTFKGEQAEVVLKALDF